MQHARRTVLVGLTEMRGERSDTGTVESNEPLVCTVTSTVLLERLRDPTNDDVWAEFDARYRPLLRSYVQRSFGLPVEDAEDVAQAALATFASAYCAGKYDRDKGRLRSWLFGIATHQAQAARRRLRRSREVQAPDRQEGTAFLERVPADEELEEQWETEWRRAVYRQCLAEVRLQMDARTVEAFELLTRGELSGQEVADRLGMSRGAVYVARHRVLRRIRQLVPIVEDAW